MKFTTNAGSVFFGLNAGSGIAPITSGQGNCGLSSQYWANVYTNNLTLSAGKYLNYTSLKIQCNSDFKTVGSINLTGNMVFENYASISIKDSGGTARVLTVKLDATVGKYILST